MAADYQLPMPTNSARPLIVRLRNWVGDVTLSLPLLQRLSSAGFDLVLLGKGWARDLLAGQGWPVHVLAPDGPSRVRQLRQLRAQHVQGRRSPGASMDALCLPDSFSSALEFRLAGLRALGHAWEGRSLLLGRAVKRQRGVHELQVYWQLGDALLGQSAPLPAQIDLQPTSEQRAQAQALRQATGIERGFVCICPFAGGTWDQQDKTWPGFADFAARALPSLGRSVVVCPGPGEEERIARQQFPGARLLSGVKLGAYAALLQDSGVMVSNDTGPAHLAAAVGTPVVSVMGPSDPRLWHPWGSAVQVLGGNGAWPVASAVMQAVAQALAAQRPASD
jgi:ADP-heptose:LPS heptosyltransferase